MRLIACILITLSLTFAHFAQAGQLYIFESDGNGFNTKTFFYDTGKEVIAIDAQFTYEQAQKSIDFIKAKTTNPITYLIITHPNPDKVNGIPVFRKAGAKVMGSRATLKYLEDLYNYKKNYFVNMAKMFTEETYPKLPLIDIYDWDTETLTLKNKEKIEIQELNRSGVSTNQTVVYIPSLNSLIVGDLVHYDAHAWLEGPIVNNKTAYSAENWIAVLKKIQTLYKSDVVVYGGRGKSGKLMDVIPAQITYLNKAQEITKLYVGSLPGVTWEEKKKNVNYADLTKEFEKTFPTYTLSYMITYGSYGLVNSL